MSHLMSLFLENFAFVNYVILDYDEIPEENEKKPLLFGQSFKTEINISLKISNEMLTV